MDVSAMQVQLGDADLAVSELEKMGSRVLAVYLSLNYERPRILIANPDPLCQALDREGVAVTVEPGQAKWREGRAVFHDCDVQWLFPNVAAVQTSAGAKA